MFQSTSCLKRLPNLSVVRKLLCNSNKSFCNKSNNDDPQKHSEEAEISKLLDDSASYSDLTNTEWATTPYPASATSHIQDEPKRPKITPTERTIILFPGQGIIKVGDVQ